MQPFLIYATIFNLITNLVKYLVYGIRCQHYVCMLYEMIDVSDHNLNTAAYSLHIYNFRYKRFVSP